MPDALQDVILDFRETDLPAGVPRRVDVTPVPGKTYWSAMLFRDLVERHDVAHPRRSRIWPTA